MSNAWAALKPISYQSAKSTQPTKSTNPEGPINSVIHGLIFEPKTTLLKQIVQALRYFFDRVCVETRR
jgi:hypothetical protein